MGRLTAKRVESLKRPGRYGDIVPTLYLVVTRSGSRNWVQRIMVDGQRRDLGLGGFPAVGLSEAREQALANRQLVRRGEIPLAGRASKVPTFKKTAGKTLDANRGRWTAQSCATWLAMLERYAFPTIGDRRVDRILQSDVLRVMAPVWTSKPPTARKLRGAIRATLAWSQAHGYTDHNVAGEAIDGALPAQPAVRGHHRAVPYAEVGEALRKIDASTASLPVRACVRFIAITGVRSTEARKARWEEFDLPGRVWRVPASRMKMRIEFRVPLSDAAIQALEAVRGLHSPAGYVFPSASKPGKPISYNLSRVLESVGLDATVHGFRAGFRTWGAEMTSHPHAVCEMALAHRVGGDVVLSYSQGELFDKRRQLMDDWAQFVTN